MKRLVLILTALFLANLLNAENIDKRVVLLNMASDDLRGIEVDDYECQNAILNFYAIVIKNDNKNTEFTKKYKNCIAKKQKTK